MGAENSPQTAFYDEIIRMAANENIQVKFELKKEIKKVRKQNWKSERERERERKREREREMQILQAQISLLT